MRREAHESVGFDVCEVFLDSHAAPASNFPIILSPEMHMVAGEPLQLTDSSSKTRVFMLTYIIQLTQLW